MQQEWMQQEWMQWLTLMEALPDVSKSRLDPRLETSFLIKWLDCPMAFPSIKMAMDFVV
jgi:hypothetical protein